MRGKWLAVIILVIKIFATIIDVSEATEAFMTNTQLTFSQNLTTQVDTTAGHPSP